MSQAAPFRNSPLSRAAGQALSGLALLALSFGLARGLVRALPGDPVETLISETGTSVPAEEIRREMGLDLPFLPALARDAGRWMHGDFGSSLLSRKPVAPVLLERLGRTALLSALAFALAAFSSTVLGVLAAARPGSLIDWFCTGTGTLTSSLPIPWIGPVLLLAFAVKIPLFPSDGSVFLPAIALALSLTGFWSRLIRERVRDGMNRGWADPARARGLSEPMVLLKYGFAPVLGALLAYLGTQIGVLLGGSYVVEVVFNWKGMGSLLVDSVLKRDYPLIEAVIFVSSALALLGSRIGDWAQVTWDPRGGNSK